MFKKGFWVRNSFIASLFIFPLTAHASLIESTIGAAVVNDATATYYNPAALTLLKNPQIIPIGSVAYFRTNFTGQVVQSRTGFTQFGTANTRSNYFLPSMYLGIPIGKKVTVGFAVIYNNFSRDIDDNSLLRYVQSNNHIQNIDFVPAVGFKLNECFSLGAGLDLSRVNFIFEPISGIPSLTIPDSISRNESSATSWGGHIGFLLKPTSSTLMGFNYRTSVTYHLDGKSILEGNPKLISNNYNFKFWTPARSVFSINHFVTKTVGLIGTLQYIQWNLFKDVNFHGLATKIGKQPVILSNATAHFHLHNSWILTLGGHYRVTPKWIIRLVGSYVESPSNPHFQISNGDSFLLGASTGYDISKYLTLDVGYAHAFMKNQTINITTRGSVINGVNQGSRDAFSLKITLNIV